MIFDPYQNYYLRQLEKLISIPSPTGMCEEITSYMCGALDEMGLEYQRTNKGDIYFTLGGNGDPILVVAHLDTLGAQVKEILSDGRLRITPVGGLNPNNVEGENVIVHTKFDGDYEGTILIENASTHVNKEYNVVRAFEKNLEVVLDKHVSSREGAVGLGIRHGDMVSIEPRFRISSDGFIKSRFLDDKMGVALLMTFVKYVLDQKLPLKRKTYIAFSVFEEVLHGIGSGLPDDIVELLAIDMGCVGVGLDGDETKVSIIAGDSHGPYDHQILKELISLCEEKSITYAVDSYTGYVSDASAALHSGWDIRHAAFGPGVYASHSYERMNIEGAENAFLLLVGYLLASEGSL